MGNLTLNDRMDALEIIVRGLVTQVDVMGEKVDVLKQPVIIERIKFKNRVKPKPKKRDIEKGRKRAVLVSEDRVPGIGE